MFNVLAALCVAFLSLSAAQKDPLKDFCRLHSHQTTIVDRRLYVDGGLANWSPLSANAINYTSTWLKYGNLDVDNQGFPQEYVLSKNDSVPSVYGGVLWSDATNKVVYMYGGNYGNTNLRIFDYGTMTSYIIRGMYPVSPRQIYGGLPGAKLMMQGAGVAVQDRGLGYYYGGWLSNSSVPGYQSQTPLKNMLVYDMIGNSFRNQSGPDDIPRAEGVMVYLPVGDGGFLAYFGGIQFPYGNATMVASPMTDIFLYDIANNQWYKQTASGSPVPENRRRFCAGAAWANDRSSYNIYLFGGAPVGNGVGFGDVWILSIPSFRWIKFYPTEADGFGDPFPHHSLTCDVIDNSQMIIMGGTFPNHTDNCDVPTIYGQHGLDLGKANAKGAKWASYDPKVTTYKVPTEIATVIGGAPTGGATVLAPTSGWAHRDLQAEFQRAYTPTSRTATRYIPPATAAPTPTPSIAPKSDKKRAIIGGAVGGGVGLILIAAIGICFCLRRRRKSKESSSTRPPSELPSQSMTHINHPAGPTLQGFPNVTQYAYTPQGSPPPPSERTWTHYGSLTPDHPGSPDLYKEGAASPHHRYPSDGSYNQSVQLSSTGYYEQPPRSPVTGAHEMPIVRSPHPVDVRQQPQALNIAGVDPYFAQHPPRGN